jgi:hypothetical protein
VAKGAVALSTAKPPGGRRYPLGSTRRDARPPSYERVVRGLSDRELREEIDAGLGSEEYQQALAAEAERRLR